MGPPPRGAGPGGGQCGQGNRARGPMARRAATAGTSRAVGAASGGSSTSRAPSCAASARARLCGLVTRSRCGWGAWIRGAAGWTSTWRRPAEEERGTRRAWNQRRATGRGGRLGSVHDGQDARRQAQGGRGGRGEQPLRLLPLRAAGAPGVRDRAAGHRGQGAARLGGAAERGVRRDPRRGAVAAQRAHPPLRPRGAREPRARARPQAAGAPL